METPPKTRSYLNEMCVVFEFDKIVVFVYLLYNSQSL